MDWTTIEKLLNIIRNRASNKDYVVIAMSYGEITETFQIIDIVKFGKWWKATVIAPEGWWRGDYIELPISQAQLDRIFEDL